MVKNDPLSLWRASADRQLMVQEGHVMAKNDHSWRKTNRRHHAHLRAGFPLRLDGKVLMKTEAIQ